MGLLVDCCLYQHLLVTGLIFFVFESKVMAHWNAEALDTLKVNPAFGMS